ncbi:MAG: response regulator [Bacteroidales bacterium]|jgi:DNA-binding NarL/FixJ family response regulator|nr:response regulator transcription factor [Bacteroidales bacterium]
MKLAIIEDHNIVRKGLVEIISNFGNFTFVIEAENGKDFIEKYKQTELLPEICIVDIKMPEMNGFQLVQYLKTNFPKIKILILTTYDEEYFLIKMIKLGVNGYLLKDCHPEELKSALLAISENSYFYNNIFSKRLQRLVETNFIKLPNITENEKSFLEICGEDLTYSQMAQKLNKSQRSIEGYRDSLFNKFEVNNRASLVLLAVKLGIIKI